MLFIGSLLHVDVKMVASQSFIPSIKKLKLLWQPIHNPINLKQAKLSQKSTILEIAIPLIVSV
jgi:hypothetical protein